MRKLTDCGDLLNEQVRQRRIFATLFVGSILLLIYASILPVKYQAVTFANAVKEFVDLPWLDIQLYGRADWAANLLVVLPLGWLGAAAIDWRRSTRRPLLIAIPPLTIFLCAIVLGIEFLQAWFPTRTQSLNDVLAGCLGALFGPLIWLIGGRWTLQAASRVLNSAGVRDRFWLASLLYMIANLIFAAMPFDIILNTEELRQKILLGRIEFMPELNSVGDLTKPAFLSVIRVVRLTLLLCFSRGVPSAVILSIVFSALCELVQIPVFTRTASLFDVIAAGFGVMLSVVAYYMKAAWMPILRRPAIWLLVALLSAAGLLGVIVLKSDQLIQDPVEISQRWQRFFGWPMAGYYYQAEFSALTTLVYKSIIFSWIGGCFGMAVAMSGRASRKQISTSVTVLMIALAIATEVSQIYLRPHIPDAFDICVYATTMLIAAKIIRGVQEDNSGNGFDKGLDAA